MSLHILSHFIYRDRCGLPVGVTIDTATDSREGQLLQMILARNSQAVAVTGGQQLRLCLLTSSLDRSYRVNNVSRRQAVSLGNFSSAGIAATELTTFRQQFRTGSTVYRSVDTTTAQQALIRGIHYGVDLEARNITAYHFNRACHQHFREQRGHEEDHHGQELLQRHQAIAG
jgi:hypothetical protein